MKKVFRIVCECISDIPEDDLWPDGDMPQNLTAKSVEDLIEYGGGIYKVIHDWNLEADLTYAVEELYVKKQIIREDSNNPDDGQK